ncbi:hypothetical protein G6F70_005835 [Rhizopus microsporus]|nr:hypothetical protein G6F71_001844 [Rhizopus microsporus]KAG1198389.1 hypothetical protein G6F70_005835 [Rhizopus microsporus]KAG1210841.1 hypothetical protein G6F69_005116 [Rhizopus microsporus]KAG1232669.1 hypothetical protein G6F67_004840 [Rhizopus microsporus]KAG1264097.1 hypothetical protein G6F68_004622 [Rhizopus microsporus]
MEEEEEICRVCRSGETEDQPLFYPCKCSGSIRYVHQDCLLEWLKHSRKERCELCEHPFTFTPVYRQDMPEVLPAVLYLRQLRKKVGFVISNALRATLVFNVWLTILPYFTVWIWRLYFYMGHSLSRQLADLYQLRVGQNVTDTKPNESFFQEYKSRLNLQEWVVQNLPAIDEAEQMRAANDFIPEIQQPIFEEPLVREPEAEQIQQVEAPPSPVAPSEDGLDEWLTHLSSSSTAKPMRAASMPPSFPSYHHDMEEPQGRQPRSASVEPFLMHQENGSQSTRGRPPYAPLVRNADTPILNIPLIPEEQENDEDRVNHLQEHQLIERLVPEVNEQSDESEPEDGDDEDDNDEVGGEAGVDGDEGIEEDDDDDGMGNFGEDIEGVLEAIGMRGSFWILAQNATLMALLIALILFTGVCLPYMMGAIFILAMEREFIEFPLEIISLIHKHIGKLTDPLFDPLLTIYFDHIWPTVVLFYNSHLNPLIQTMTSSRLFQQISHSISSDHLSVIPSTGLVTDRSAYMIDITAFYNQSKPFLKSLYNRYQLFALGESSIDRFSCIFMGSKVVYNVFGNTAQEALRQYVIILKLTMFITIELLIFPLVCGALLDATTLPLFEGATLKSRMELSKSNPVSSIFIHWFIGTGFMFLFAVFVTLCRSIVRPGVMWFIRDPTDPQFHPLREIVERPVLFQYKKIGASGLVYIFVIFVCIGGVIHALNLMGDTILPLRWRLSDARNPLSIVPIDLLTTQLALPAIINYLQPKRIIKKWFVRLITFTCHQLRLTSFVFGRRDPREEGELVYHTWTAWIKRTKPRYYPLPGQTTSVIGPEVSFIWNGQLLRVPKHDRVPVIPNRRMLVPVDPFVYEPLDENERRLGHPASTADGGDEANTTIVYSPPHFYRRVIAMIIIDVSRQRTARSKLKKLTRYAHQCLYKALRWVFFLVSFGLIVPFALGALMEFYFIIPTSNTKKLPLEVSIIPLWANGIVCMVVVHGLAQVLPDNQLRATINNVFQGGIGRMNIRQCLRDIVGPVLFVSTLGICLPPLMAYIDLKFLDNMDNDLKLRLLRVTYPTALIGGMILYLIKLGTRIGRGWSETIRDETYLVGRVLHNLDN